MRHPSPYLKMRVLGAIDSAEGRTSHQRILNVAGMTFIDEDGNRRSFTGIIRHYKGHYKGGHYKGR